MANKVFKITLTVVYNNDTITPDNISDNIFVSMKKIDKGLAMLNVDSIKELSRPNQTIKSIIENMAIQDENEFRRSKNHVEVTTEKKIKKVKKNEDKK